MTSANPYESNPTAVDSQIGSDYPTIEFVAMNMPYIKHVSLNMEGLAGISGNLDDILAVTSNIPFLTQLSTQIPELLVLRDVTEGYSHDAAASALLAEGLVGKAQTALQPEAIGVSIAPYEPVKKFVDNQLPNKLLRTDPNPNNTGAGGEPPWFGTLYPMDLAFPIITYAIGGTQRQLLDMIRDHGRSFQNYVDLNTPLDQSTQFGNAIRREDTIIIDRPGIHFTKTVLGGAVANNTCLISILGFNVPTYWQQDPASHTFNLADTKNFRMEGHHRIDYQIPGNPTSRGVSLVNAENIYIESMVIVGAGIGLYLSGSKKIRFGYLEIREATGEAIQLLSGSNLQIDTLVIDAAALRGLVVNSGWGGGLSIKRLIVKNCQQHGVEYSAAGNLIDVIDEIYCYNNGLLSLGSYDGVKINGSANGLDINGGMIGNSPDWVRAKGTITVSGAVAVGDTVTINGTVLTAVAGAPVAGQFRAGGSAISGIGYLYEALTTVNAGYGNIPTAQFSTSGLVLNIEASAAGTPGNDVTIAVSSASLTASGPKLTGGAGAITQKAGVEILAGAKRINIDAALLGNGSAYLNSAAADNDVNITGMLPAGVTPLYSKKTKDGLLGTYNQLLSTLAPQANQIPIMLSPTQAGTVEYSEGTFTPIMSLATPGDSVVSHSVNLGYYKRIGKLVFVTAIVTATITHTTGSGNLQMTLPFVAMSGSGNPQPGLNIINSNAGLNWSTFTQLLGRVLYGQALMIFNLNKSAGSSGLLTSTSITSGTAFSFQVSGVYAIA